MSKKFMGVDRHPLVRKLWRALAEGSDMMGPFVACR